MLQMLTLHIVFCWKRDLWYASIEGKLADLVLD